MSSGDLSCVRRIFHGPSLAVSLTLCLLCCTASAQSQETTAPPKAEEAAAAQSELFPIPEGTAEELFAFIEKVQQAPLPEGQQTRAASLEFFKAQITAVLKACDKVDALKPGEKAQVRCLEERFMAYQNLTQIDDDAKNKLSQMVQKLQDDKRPDIVRLVSGYKLETTAPGFFRLEEPQQKGLIKDLLIYMDRFGIDNTSYAVGTGLGDAIEMSNTPEIAAPIFDALARELKRSGDPRMAPQVARYEGIARRLNLPGKFMEIQGTTVAGEEFDWKSYRGKVVLVDFWASWCGPCRAEIPNMKAQLEKYGDRGFAIVGISLDNTKDDYRRCIEREEITWVNLMSQNEGERSWNHPLAVHYGVGGIPMAILVDQQGKVVSLTATGAELNEHLARMLGEPDKQPERASETDAD